MQSGAPTGRAPVDPRALLNPAIPMFPGATGAAVATTTAPSTMAPSSDVLVGEVTEDKANLRSGPGTENSPVMQVQRGTRLTIEAREGDWYRVMSPTGTRAYIKSDVVRTQNDGANKLMPPFPRRVEADPNFAMPAPSPNGAPPVGPGAFPTSNAQAGSPPDDEARAAFESLKAQIKATRP